MNISGSLEFSGIIWCSFHMDCNGLYWDEIFSIHLELQQWIKGQKCWKMNANEMVFGVLCVIKCKTSPCRRTSRPQLTWISTFGRTLAAATPSPPHLFRHNLVFIQLFLSVLHIIYFTVNSLTRSTWIGVLNFFGVTPQDNNKYYLKCVPSLCYLQWSSSQLDFFSYFLFILSIDNQFEMRPILVWRCPQPSPSWVHLFSHNFSHQPSPHSFPEHSNISDSLS